eukprot:1693701-Pleurochrysis_carterae.AAC.1
MRPVLQGASPRQDHPHHRSRDTCQWHCGAAWGETAEGNTGGASAAAKKRSNSGMSAMGTSAMGMSVEGTSAMG